MDVYHGYSYGTALWGALQSLPLLASPTMIVTLLSPEIREPSPLEIYLTRGLGLTLLSFSILSLLLTGAIPLTSSLRATTAEEDPRAPYTVPTLGITMAYHVAAMMLTYAFGAKGHSFTYYIAAIVEGVLAAVGLWCMLFATDNGRISRKTGADTTKGTSGFPFENKEHTERVATKKEL
ncbi:hypothetical protein SAICODRAFT_30408 [Saitoella complicata NRRL Y-17804]|uniref:uncharacterized protein n=1 Tax=Saitoella complicata (strain BCRC 22490 / CBS 7301 / JCM 7358 / NBRC 10748 / NRRL Y-17804) TaxID=698492 RepID=UPI0008675FA2|nr:uncharacterized protein SAICODRAFT_30408 [Saitoella complicata NRRL Y-17804]ODQ53002.1 hypothetical protein SAICODRAFT_30408 [Saitoella complicata NRRL Y-17804]